MLWLNSIMGDVFAIAELNLSSFDDAGQHPITAHAGSSRHWVGPHARFVQAKSNEAVITLAGEVLSEVGHRVRTVEIVGVSDAEGHLLINLLTGSEDRIHVPRACSCTAKEVSTSDGQLLSMCA